MSSTVLFFYTIFQHYILTSIVLSVILLFLLFGFLRQFKITWVASFFYVLFLGFFIYSYRTDYRFFHRYIYKNGVEGELILSEYKGTGRFNKLEEINEAVGTLSLENKETLSVQFVTDPPPQYPSVSPFVMQVQSPYRVRYMAENPSFFVIDQTLANVSKRISCSGIKMQLKMLDSLFAKDPNQGNIRERKKEAEAKIAECESEGMYESN